jgi:hypothetical protein
MASLEFFSDIILPVAPWLWGRLSLYQKWVPGVFPGCKGGRCVRLTTSSPSCAVVIKSGNLKFLEPSGPLRWQPHHHPVPLSWNLGTLSSWNTLGHSRPVTGLLYLFNVKNCVQWWKESRRYLSYVRISTIKVILQLFLPNKVIQSNKD